MNPQYGICTQEEADRLVTAFELLDEGLTAGSEYPTDRKTEVSTHDG